MFNYGIHSRTAFLNKIVWKWKCFLCDGMCNVKEENSFSEYYKVIINLVNLVGACVRGQIH